MSLTVAARGKHTAAYLELEARVQQLEADNEALRSANEDLVCDLTRTIIRASQDAMWRAQADEENGRLKAANEEWRRKTVRAQAEQERLRRAVVKARPKLHQVPTDLVRPYITGFRLPYLSAIPYRDTSSDETQELPVLDWPTYGQPAA